MVKSVYQSNLQKKAFVLCKWIWGNELLLPSFISDRNNVVMKQSFLPNFQAIIRIRIRIIRIPGIRIRSIWRHEQAVEVNLCDR